MNGFRAKYKGTCGECGFTISPGEWVTYDDDYLIHEICKYAPKLPEIVCPKCNIAHAGKECY